MRANTIPLESSPRFDFITSHPSTGAALTATSTVVEVFENDTDAPILTPTATERSGRAGDYRVQVEATTANGFVAGRSYNVVVTAVVAEVTARGVVATFMVGPPVIFGMVMSDAGNTATSFKTDLSQATDTWKDALLTFISGALAGQVKKVSGFNGSTHVITCGAFTTTPSADDRFVLVNV